MNGVPVTGESDSVDGQVERRTDAGPTAAVGTGSGGRNSADDGSLSSTPAPQTADPFGVEAYRDERYRFQGFSQDFLIGLGRLTLGASYLEGTIATMLWRLIDNDDLRLGERVTADVNFRWLVDHTRAVSEHRLPAELHGRLADWLGRSQRAYGDRNRIVHSGHAISVRADGSGLAHVWVRGSARGKSFSQEVRPAEAAELHDIAVRLERLGLEGVDLMAPVQEALGGGGGEGSD